MAVSPAVPMDNLLYCASECLALPFSQSPEAVSPAAQISEEGVSSAMKK